MANVVVPPLDEAPSTVVGSTPQSVFPFDFPFWDTVDIRPSVDGLTLAPGSFTVEGFYVQNGEMVEGGYGSGQVTLNTPVSNCTVVIDRFVRGARESQFSRAAPPRNALSQRRPEQVDGSTAGPAPRYGSCGVGFSIGYRHR
jgi:hypothetical protein